MKCNFDNIINVAWGLVWVLYMRLWGEKGFGRLSRDTFVQGDIHIDISYNV